jgi:glycosyltransferase involved in cell wall biosynthesis
MKRKTGERRHDAELMARSVDCLPKVLIGIVTKNRATVVPQSIESALSQQGALVSVIDDGSTDTTHEVARGFQSANWIMWSVSRGYVAARNYWIDNASVDYFVGLDDDAWFLQGDEVAVAGSIMQTNPKIAAIAFDILSPDRPERRPRSGMTKVSSFIGCGHMLRLSAVREVGGYAPTPGSYGGEEKDLCLRLIDAGYEIISLSGVHVWHDKTQVSRELPEQHRSGVCNDLVMTIRRAPGLLLPAALTVKFYRHSFFAVRKGLTKPTLAGFALFLRSLPEAWRTRKPVKASTLRAFMQLRPK